MSTEIKPRKSVIRRQKKEALKLAKAKGAVVAKLNDVPTSPRKMRLVADLVRGKRVSEALAILRFQPKQGAKKIEQLLLTAISDWTAKNDSVNLEEADLYIKTLFVDGGRMLKRLRPAPQGRGYRVRKRSNHITLELDSLVSIDTLIKKVEEQEKKEDKKSSKSTAKGTKKSSKKSE